MEIRHKTHNLFRAHHVAEAAKQHNCYANVKWSDPFSVRFTLHSDGPGSPAADVATHDKVILALLTLDPDATVRTARATYESLADFNAQKAARVA
jgi:hypothetical protein